MGMKPIYREAHRWMCLPFFWGETDCMMVIADWIKQVRGVDPAAHLRGTYDSRNSCQRATGFLRDPVAAVDAALATIGGLPRVSEPQTGDIAVLVVPEGGGRAGPCGGLWLGSAWACKGLSGTTTVKPSRVLDVMAIWGVGYEA